MSEQTKPARQDMSVLEKRLDLVNRYNHALGQPGPGVTYLQREFINGLMRPEWVACFVDECEMLIESSRRCKRGHPAIQSQSKGDVQLNATRAA